MSNPSPTEVRQAALLANALDNGPGHDWTEMDGDVREAVYALRPELAPALRDGLLDEALSEVMEGPLAVEPGPEEVAEASALAAALETSTTALDADLAHTVYALSPARAPDPDIALDAVLDAVTTGPFAPVILVTGEFPAEIAPPTNLRDQASEGDVPAEVVSLIDRRRSATPSVTAAHRRWLPAVGALAAAAATLLVVVPSLSMHPSSSEPPLAAAPTTVELEEAAAPAPNDPPDDADLALRDPPDGPSTAPSTKTRAVRSAKRSAPLSQDARPTPPSPAPTPEPGVASSAHTGSSAATTFATRGHSSDGYSDTPVTHEDARGVGVGGEEDAAMEAPEAPKLASTGATASPRGRSAAPSVSSANEASSLVPNVGLLEPRLYQAHPELQAAWAEAHQAEIKGDYVSAARILLTIAARTSDSDVLADAAIRAGSHLLKVGDLEGASAALARSEAVSPKSTRIRVARRNLKRRIATIYEP